jgi:putative adenylate-forming enzyme
VISSHERSLWLGSILARCLPDFPWTKHRVAVMLATGNDLYKTANASGRLVFRFFDLKQGLESHATALTDFSPDVLIAPPKAVRILADASVRLKLKYIFTGGDVLDPLDATPIKNWFGVRPRSIYQATEGFLGVACNYGLIHLNEDDMLFEEEPIVGHPNHFVPIITDLRRRAQAMIRYRLNDVLVKLPGQCKCGSPLVALQRVEGRCDDILSFESASGEGTIQVMPEALRAVILDADRSLSDFRLVQKTATILELQLTSGTSKPLVKKIISELSDYLVKVGGTEKIEIEIVLGIEKINYQKLRRIRSELKPGQ